MTGLLTEGIQSMMNECDAPFGDVGRDTAQALMNGSQRIMVGRIINNIKNATRSIN